MIVLPVSERVKRAVSRVEFTDYDDDDGEVDKKE